MESGDDVTATLGSQRCGAQDLPVLSQALRDLARWASIPIPTLWVLPTPEPNAFATGYSPYDSAVTVTTGLLEQLDGREVRAVLAHEVGHIVNGDTPERTKAVATAAVQMGVALGARRVAHVAAVLSGRGLGYLAWGGTALAERVVRRRAVRTVARNFQADELAADRVAVSWGSGKWLASALVKLEYAARLQGSDFPDWSRLMLTVDSDPSTSTHPPVHARVAAIPDGSLATVEDAWCRTCRAALSTAVEVCPECGATQEHRTCSCGAAIGVEDRFCTMCRRRCNGEPCRGCGRAVDAYEPFCRYCGSPLP